MHFSLADECKIFLAICCDWQKIFAAFSAFLSAHRSYFNDDKGVRIDGAKVPTLTWEVKGIG